MSVPFISPALLARALLVQQVLNLARAVPSFVYEIYPQMVGVFLCLIALSLGKHGLRTLSQRSLALFCLLVVVSTCVDVALWVSTFWAIRHGNDNSVKASFWYAIVCHIPKSLCLSCQRCISLDLFPLTFRRFAPTPTPPPTHYRVFTVLQVILLVANIVSIREAYRLVSKMKRFSLHERMLCLQDMEVTSLGGRNSNTSSRIIGDPNSDLRVISTRPRFHHSAFHLARSQSTEFELTASAVDRGPSARTSSIGSSAEVTAMAAANSDQSDASATTLGALDASFLSFDGAQFCENAVHKSKYNVATFLPLFLFAQFSRLANLYTLLIVCICFASFSPLRPEAAMVPLLIVLTTAAVKEAVEDARRRAQDRAVNECAVDILVPTVVVAGDAAVAVAGSAPDFGPGPSAALHRDEVGVVDRSCADATSAGAAVAAPAHFERKCWQDIHVGDIVRVRADEFFPADLVLLACSNETGRCFVETANLDGTCVASRRHTRVSVLPRCSLSRTNCMFFRWHCKSACFAPLFPLQVKATSSCARRRKRPLRSPPSTRSARTSSTCAARRPTMRCTRSTARSPSRTSARCAPTASQARLSSLWEQWATESFNSGSALCMNFSCVGLRSSFIHSFH